MEYGGGGGVKVGKVSIENIKNHCQIQIYIQIPVGDKDYMVWNFELLEKKDKNRHNQAVSQKIGAEVTGGTKIDNNRMDKRVCHDEAENK